MVYYELQTCSNFSFHRGASHAEELVIRAKELGLSGIALTDHNSLAGIVRAHRVARDIGIAFLPGCRLDLTCGTSFLVWPQDKAGYSRLTQLLTRGNRRTEKGACILTLDDLAAHNDGMTIALIARKESPEQMARLAVKLGRTDLFVATSFFYDGQDARRIGRIFRRGEKAGLRPLATGDIRYHSPARRPLLDVMTAIRHHTTVDKAGYLLAANAERFLKPPAEMTRLFAEWPDAIANTRVVFEACNFSLDMLQYNYPTEPVPHGKTPQQELCTLARKGAKWRFPQGIPPNIGAILEKELALVDQLNYAAYFLTVHDIVRFARSRNILCQGRGSAANSIICYCLGITSVNPEQVDLLFERFISQERGEPPDIDVDFEHNRREEVIQYIYARYGRHRAALTATVISYRARSAIRDVGKAMGLTSDSIDHLAGSVWGSYGREIGDDSVREAGLSTQDPRLAQTLELTHALIGFPRHLSQHVGGFVLTEEPLDHIVPIQNAAMRDRTVIEWDKDDLDTLKILKVDVLALGMLTALQSCFHLLHQHYGYKHSLASLPRDDGATYAMLCRADSIGVFQVESRAQMSMLPRLRPRCFYDLVIQVAIVRPGPIQGDMVHPYLRRRQGKETITYPSPDPRFGPADELEQVLRHTYGVPLFQEQAMKIAIVAAGFSPGEADALRRAMATFRRTGSIGGFHTRFVEGMTKRGYHKDFAERCFKQIEGFADYGFPESHAASFALLVEASAYIKCHYPAVFTCALLNAQPMGFYAPAQLIRDAREHHVSIRPIDVNHSAYDCTLEPEPSEPRRFALRLGFRLIKGFGEAQAAALIAARQKGRYRSIAGLYEESGLNRQDIERLADADAMGSMGLRRREALWQARALEERVDLPLFTALEQGKTDPDSDITLPAMTKAEEVALDYQNLRFSLKAHPLVFLRPLLENHGILPCAALASIKDGAKTRVAGLVLVRQRPGSAKGVIFVTLEDESGVANAVIWQQVFEENRKTVMSARLVVLEGRIQKEDDVIHLVVRRIYDASPLLLSLNGDMGDARAAEYLAATLTDRKSDNTEKLPQLRAGHPRNLRDMVPKGRNFH